MSFLVVITGTFNSFLIFFILILVHELGHFLTGYFLKWHVDKIYFYPYGGYTKFNDDINKPLKEELLILIMGPLVQIIFYMLTISFFSTRDQNIIRTYHYSILFFNLLPIYPLDGGKLLNIALSYFFSYKKSYIFTMFISYFVATSLFFLLVTLPYNYSFNLYLMISLIVVKLTEEYKKRRYYFNKFKLERYIKDYRFNKLKIVNNIDDMMRDKRHIIKNKKGYFTEKQILSKKYKI